VNDYEFCPECGYFLGEGEPVQPFIGPKTQAQWAMEQFMSEIYGSTIKRQLQQNPVFETLKVQDNLL